MYSKLSFGEILLYGDVSVESLNTIFDHETYNIPTQMTIFSTSITILMHLLALGEK